jgi:hypothetical protein
LKDDPELAAQIGDFALAQGIEALPVHLDVALGRTHLAVDAFEQARFALPRAPHEEEKLTATHREGDLGQCVDAVRIDETDVSEKDHAAPGMVAAQDMAIGMFLSPP